MHRLGATSQPDPPKLPFDAQQFLALSDRNPQPLCSSAGSPRPSSNSKSRARILRDGLPLPTPLLRACSRWDATTPASHPHGPLGSTRAATVAASSHRLSSSGRHPADNRPLPDPPLLCPVCGVTSANSCLDCDREFCRTHLYLCIDCGNQYCSACLDAHRDDGHWSDSDTAAELASAHIVHGPVPKPPDLNLSSVIASHRLASAQHIVHRPVPKPPDLNLSSVIASHQPKSRSWRKAIFHFLSVIAFPNFVIHLEPCL
jgi:hypothetical protein